MGSVTAILILLLCYATGCLSPSWLAVRWLGGKDLRACGTGTVGATNAGRVLGRKGFVLIALLDIFKGWGAMLAAYSMGLTGWWLAGAGLAVVAGHIWPAPLKFRGGKGMATAYGVILYISPLTALLMWPVFWLGRLVLRSTILAALQAFLSVPLFVMSMNGGPPAFALATLLAALLVWTHRPNIKAELARRKAESAAA